MPWPFSRRDVDTSSVRAEIRALQERITAAEEDLQVLRAIAGRERVRLDELEKLGEVQAEQLKSMRGYVYAKLGSATRALQRGGTPKLELPQTQSRDQLRQQLVRTGRFVPGRPPVHTKDSTDNGGHHEQPPPTDDDQE